MPTGVYPRSTSEDRLLGRVSVGHPGGCWGWDGYTDGFGYGRIQHGGKVQQAHRVAWTLFNGAIPDGLCVLHRCDNPPCTNPDHLFLGTKKDNMADAMTKGRFRPRCKLSPDQVSAIRSSADRGTDLSRQYQVAQSTISMIRMGRRWKTTEV